MTSEQCEPETSAAQDDQGSTAQLIHIEASIRLIVFIEPFPRYRTHVRLNQRSDNTIKGSHWNQLIWRVLPANTHANLASNSNDKWLDTKDIRIIAIKKLTDPVHTIKKILDIRTLLHASIDRPEVYQNSPVARGTYSASGFGRSRVVA